MSVITWIRKNSWILRKLKIRKIRILSLAYGGNVLGVEKYYVASARRAGAPTGRGEGRVYIVSPRAQLNDNIISTLVL